MLDISLFRTGMRRLSHSNIFTTIIIFPLIQSQPTFAEKGGDPDVVRESQRRRFSDEAFVDKVLDLDKQWREGRKDTATHANVLDI